MPASSFRPADPHARVRFLSRLALAEMLVQRGDLDAPFQGTVRELSDLALGPMASDLSRDVELRRRWDLVFAATDRPSEPADGVPVGHADAFAQMLEDAESALAGNEDERDWALTIPVPLLHEDAAKFGVPEHLRQRYDALPGQPPTIEALIRSGVVCGTCADEGETACRCYEALEDR